MAYRETIVHGDSRLPSALYHITAEHPRYRMNPHWHPEIEILAVHKGIFRLRLNDTDYTLGEGSVTLIAGGSIHGGEPENCEYTCVLVNSEFLTGAGEREDALLGGSPNRKASDLPELNTRSDVYYALCREMLDVWRRGGDGYPFFMKSLLLRFWGTVLERKDDLSSPPAPTGQGQTDRMKSVISYLERHYQDKVTLKELARIADLSPNHFCKTFRRTTGYTPFTYLNRYRLEKARYALEVTDLTVTEIALDCGINDVSHFIKSFRLLYGETPNRIRKQAQTRK